MAKPKNIQELMELSDRCSNEMKWKEGAELLSSYHDTDNPQLLWRIVRDLYRTSKYFSKDAGEAEELARNGLELAKKALSLDSTSYLCYKVTMHCLIVHIKPIIIIVSTVNYALNGLFCKLVFV